MPLTVEVWSDVVCPWCYVGKRRLELALDQFDQRDSVEVVWRSFELDPAAPRRRPRPRDYVGHLAHKYGVSEDEAGAMIRRIEDAGESVGIEFRFDRAVGGNTFDAHRLLHLAGAGGFGVQGAQGALKERLLRGYFTEGRAIGEADALVALAVDAGLDEAEARGTLAEPSAYADDVREDEAAASALGARGVPFFVFGRRYAVSGAQATDLFAEVLERAWDELAETTAGGDEADRAS
jgi:predicted DsbA family dithiol-disulfide isomerase